MFTQLNPPIPFDVVDTPQCEGHGLAIAVIDYGVEHDLIWVMLMDETMEVWCVKNRFVRARANVTEGRARLDVPVSRAGYNLVNKTISDEIKEKCDDRIRQSLKAQGVTIGRWQ